MAQILVVDDEEGIREFVAEALEDDGHVAVRAADGAEAAGILAKRSFDLLITDLRMRSSTAWRSFTRFAPSSRRPKSSCSPLTAPWRPPSKR